MPEKTWAVEAQKLKMRFGNFVAVDEISFRVTTGSIYGFLGANGAGKTTTIRILCGLLKPTGGEVRVAGKFGSREPQAIKQRVGYMSQRFTLYTDLTVAENISFTAGLRKLDARLAEARARELLDFVSFTGDPATLVRQLPAGVKQQVSLAVALLHDPEVVFLDEPTAGVSPRVREKFWGLIRELAGRGKTIFVTTHYLEEAEECSSIALMRSGKIIAEGAPGELKRSTFPEPLFEIDAPGPEGAAWLDRVRTFPKALPMRPYGMRHHLRVLDPAVWKRLLGSQPETALIRKILPSLEDVFIRRVEEET